MLGPWQATSRAFLQRRGIAHSRADLETSAYKRETLEAIGKHHLLRCKRYERSTTVARSL
jgi:hypothetical protein